MIELACRELNGSEALIAWPRGAAARPLPCVVFYHGFTSSKVVYSYFAVALAGAGFRVIMPDAPDHGSRFSGDAQQRMQRFWPILVNSLHEFPALRRAIIDEGWLLDERLGVGGASMGAMTALGLMTRHAEIKCVASLMGSGYLSTLSQTLFPSPQMPGDLGEWDVGHQLAALANRKLLLWHGEEDDVVPAAESLRLQQALAELGWDANLTSRWQAGVRHRITPEALDETVRFFRQHL
ncbi:esterase [Pluralibacter gergoviae]|uniref:esterase n=1 Tax=Pluralibacter gergoviae TaxID=61647 RepID=UPI0004F6B965|nr:esterase [Pluralibacter gergoviae]AIQ99669.1 esterase [Pluralibacter gergoviae]EKW6617263.1 esterase [Pluralibacter gergoviae]KOR00629.1 esterase [Pluralibacter gergoviae]OHY67400.1 esterase [Pluralibacter gergoviae]